MGEGGRMDIKMGPWSDAVEGRDNASKRERQGRCVSWQKPG